MNIRENYLKSANKWLKEEFDSGDIIIDLFDLEQADIKKPSPTHGKNPVWTGPLSDFMEENKDGGLDEESIRASLEKDGTFIGGGGAAPLWMIVKKN
jgi:hypothetical protein